MSDNEILPMTPPKIRGALFDLDGVVVDTEGAYSRFWAQMWRDYGRAEAIKAPTTPEKFAQIIKGTTLVRILESWFPDKMVQDEIVGRLNAYELNMRYELFPGIGRLLNYLGAHRIPAAIVTSSGERKMANLFDQHRDLRQHFKAVITDAQVRHSKPHPEPYLVGADAIGMDPHDCHVFEDSLSGLAAGRAAGAYVVGVSTTLAPQIIAPHCDRLVALAADILTDLPND